MAIWDTIYGGAKNLWESQGVHTGSWGLPEFGATEAFASSRTPQGGSNILGSSTAAPITQGGGSQAPTNTQWSGPADQAAMKAFDQQQNPQYYSGGGGGGTDFASQHAQLYGSEETMPPGWTPPGYFQDQPQGPSMEELDRAYQETMGVLGGMETQAGEAHGTTQAGIRLGAKEAQTGFEAREAAESAKLAEGKEVAETGAKGAISKARKLYGDLKRSELSRLSALGLRGGSTAEASMELLGRETAGQIGGARQELTKVLNSIQVEGQRIQKWMTDQTSMLQEKTQQQLAEAKNTFDLRILQIGTMKAEAGQAKARQRMDAIESFRQDAARIAEFNSQMRLKLEQWQVEKKIMLDNAARQAADVGKFDFDINPPEAIVSGIPLSGVTKGKTGYTGYYETDDDKENTGLPSTWGKQG